MASGDKIELASKGYVDATKQDVLESGVNIKTINGESLLGDGNIAIRADVINTPVILTPISGSTLEFGDSIVASNYSTSSEYVGALEYSEWHVATDSEFTNIVHNESVSNATSYTVDGSLDESTAYYMRVRYASNGHVSGWSGTMNFTTGLVTRYGVDWDEVNDTYLRTGTSNYTFIQSQMRRCVLNADGTVKYYLHPTDSTKKADGTASILDGTDGNVMVEIPKFYYKHIKTGNVTSISISTVMLPEYAVHPAFIRAGVEKNYRYYCAYEGYNNGGKLISRSGIAPTRSQTLATFRSQANTNGTGWSLIDWNLIYAVQMLFVVEFASFKTQEILGNGNDTGGDFAMTTGGSNSIGNASSSATNDDTWMSYRGIENWYGNAYKLIDGVNIQVRSIFTNTLNNPSTYASDTFTGAYSDTGVDFLTSSGYISGLQGSNKGFIPSAVAGSSSTKVPDYFYGTTGTSNYIVFYGGSAAVSAGGGLECGGFFLSSTNTVSASGVSIGSGVAY